MESRAPNHPNRSFCAGNLRERAFREIWDGSPWFDRLRSLGRAVAACRECGYRSACSRCPAQVLVETGDTLGLLPAACEPAAIVSEIRAAAPVKDPPLASDNHQVRTAELRHPGRLVRAIAAAFGAGWRVQRGGRLPFDRLIEELRKGKPFEGALADPDLHLRVVCRLLPVLPPWRMGRCMKRSLLLLNLWSRCGLAPCVHLGVAPLGEGLLGHAWLTAEAHGRTLQAGSSEGQREAFAFPPPSF